MNFLQFYQCLLGAPGFVCIDHDRCTRPHRPCQQFQPGQIPFEVGVPHLDLERAVADGVCVGKERLELVVAEVEIETRRIGPHAVAVASEEPVQGQADLLGAQIPQRNLKGLFERQAEGAPVSPAGPLDPMHKRQRRLSDKIGPDLFLENPNDLRLVRQRVKQALEKAQPDLTVLANKLKRGYMYRIDAHLTVTYDPVTSELKTGDAKFCDAHVGVSSI